MIQKLRNKFFVVFLYIAFFSSFILIKNSTAQITVTGLNDKEDLLTYVQEKALSKYESKDDPPTRSIKIKAEIEKALRAKGYYDPKVNLIAENKDQKNAQKFKVVTGQVYTIDSINIKGVSDISVNSLQPDDILDAEKVLIAQSRLLNTIAKERCFYNLSVKHEITLDRNTKTANIRFIVGGEDNSKFGATIFKGADNIKAKHLSRFLTYKENECWSDKKVESTKTALLQTGLISKIDLNLPKDLPDNKIIPLTYEIKETAPRKIRLGTDYSTSEGVGISAQWTHKNYFGAGERLSFLSQLSTVLQSIGIDFSKPFFLSKKQSLNISSLLQRQDTDAFEEQTLDLEASIQRDLSKYWTGNLGIGFEASQITDQDGSKEDESTFGLISMPGRINFDNRDDLLDPHSGYNFSFGFEPFVDVLGESNPFLKSRITGITYFDLSDSKYDPVIALRASAGSILGSSTNTIPATKRFFSGGGGSIRGFGYQEAGPIDDEGDPSGGRSLIESSAELRLKFTDNLGGVAFVDAGGVYDNVIPNISDGVYVGAGIGARYYTSFGPIRFDVATPISRKENTDQNFQIYISIGQAF